MTGRSSSATAVAGVGVLLLAMGVGVLIGRAGDTKTSAALPAQVISVSTSGAGAAGSSTTTAPASEIPEDWPAGKSGYAVQLQTLSAAGAQASEVVAAKSAAQAKGATGVGVLLSSNFQSLPTGLYVLYSGDYSSEAQAKQALSPLKSKFPSAAVIHVTGASPSSSGEGSSSSSSSHSSSSSGGSSKGSGSGASKTPAATPKSSSPSSGQSYEQKSRSLPNVVLTG